MSITQFQVPNACWRSWILLGLLGLTLLSSSSSWANNLPTTIERVKPSVVGIGTYQETRQPRAQIRGTGFAVADGRHVITNFHVVPDKLNRERKEFLAAFVPAGGSQAQARGATMIAQDEAHDLALLRI
ncbi:MAG: serine protease, partial [Lamprobacter sp.]|uniref:S1 family peptidase n=1 Tax=Lamprobacter sp. TaxID=3100796 RepID=UPI002B25F4C8